VDCPTHEKHEIKYSTIKNDFTISNTNVDVCRFAGMRVTPLATCTRTWISTRARLPGM